MGSEAEDLIINIMPCALRIGISTYLVDSMAGVRLTYIREGSRCKSTEVEQTASFFLVQKMSSICTIIRFRCCLSLATTIHFTPRILLTLSGQECLVF